MEESKKIQIKVQTLTGKAVYVTVENSRTVRDLKTLLHQTPDIAVPPSLQKLTFGEQELVDDMVLRDAGVKQDSVLYVRLKQSQQQQNLMAQGVMQQQQQQQQQQQYAAHAVFVQPAYINPAAQRELALNRYSMSMVLVSFIQLVLGIWWIAIAFTQSKWAYAIMGPCCILLASVSAVAAQTRSAKLAKVYCGSVVCYSLIISIVIIIYTASGQYQEEQREDNDNDVSDGTVAVFTVVVVLLLGLFAASTVRSNNRLVTFLQAVEE